MACFVWSDCGPHLLWENSSNSWYAYTLILFSFAYQRSLVIGSRWSRRGLFNEISNVKNQQFQKTRNSLRFWFVVLGSFFSWSFFCLMSTTTPLKLHIGIHPAKCSQKSLVSIIHLYSKLVNPKQIDIEENRSWMLMKKRWFQLWNFFKQLVCIT